jgi:hypothetical protein
MSSTVRALAIVLPLLLLAACDSASVDSQSANAGNGVPPPQAPDGTEPPTLPTDDLTGGVVVSFTVGGESFRAWIANPETLAQLSDAWSSGSRIPGLTSVVRAGAGNSDHNLPWSWHLDPLSTFVLDFPCGSCGDALPSEVEADLDFYLSTYCMLQMAEMRVTGFDDHR